MEEFSNNLVTALKDPDVQTILKNIFRAANKQTSDAIQELQNTVVKLHADLKSRDAIIAQLKDENSLMQERIDELEQYSRKPSIRVFGIPETTGGSTDEKLLTLFNSVMEVEPPVTVEDIEVSHRIGKPQASATPPTAPEQSADHAESEAADNNSSQANGDDSRRQPAPRPIIARFASRRVKSRVMGAKKELRTVSTKNLDESVIAQFPHKAYLSDDLTQTRARLAYKARVLFRGGKISSTWVFDGRVLIKDNYNRIHEIKRESDLPQ